MKIFPVNRFNSINVICEKKNNSDYNYRKTQLNNYYPNNNISFGMNYEKSWIGILLGMGLVGILTFLRKGNPNEIATSILPNGNKATTTATAIVRDVANKGASSKIGRGVQNVTADTVNYLEEYYKKMIQPDITVKNRKIMIKNAVTNANFESFKYEPESLYSPVDLNASYKIGDRYAIISSVMYENQKGKKLPAAQIYIFDAKDLAPKVKAVFDKMLKISKCDNGAESSVFFYPRHDDIFRNSGVDGASCDGLPLVLGSSNGGNPFQVNLMPEMNKITQMLGN